MLTGRGPSYNTEFPQLEDDASGWGATGTRNVIGNHLIWGLGEERCNIVLSKENIA